MAVFSASEYDDHRIVHFVNDPKGKLRAVIALHRIVPRAGGGIRMASYASEDDAITDALRLSRAMTYKWAFAGIKRGGGKTVIIGDPRTDKTEDLLHAIGHAIERLGGIYYGGSDVGTSHEDMRVIQGVTSYIRGADPDHGDSSAATAYGVLQGIRAAAKYAFRRDELAGLKIAVQGLGHVGKELCRLLSEQGAALTVADVNPAAVKDVVASYKAHAVDPAEILYADVDILAPCAMGGVITVGNSRSIKAKVICGGANNQLATDEVAEFLRAYHVLFVPDYAVNSGGIVNGAAEGPDYDRARVWAKLDKIYGCCLEVFERAEAQNITTVDAANQMCESVIRQMD